MVEREFPGPLSKAIMNDPALMAGLSMRYASPETAEGATNPTPPPGIGDSSSSSGGVVKTPRAGSPLALTGGSSGGSPAAAAAAGSGKPPMRRLPIPGGAPARGPQPKLATQSMPMSRGAGGSLSAAGGTDGGNNPMRHDQGVAGGSGLERGQFAPLRPNQEQVRSRIVGLACILKSVCSLV